MKNYTSFKGKENKYTAKTLRTFIKSVDLKYIRPGNVSLCF